ncbi:spore germination protein [Paenibacillus sp. P25]|nr:spore germination protein [Paenibacillus sp. P25]
MAAPIKETLSTVQAAMIVLNTIIGAGVTTLPREAGKAAGTPDAWISVILGGLTALFFGYVGARLSQRFPGRTFYQYAEQLWGRRWGNAWASCFYPTSCSSPPGRCGPWGAGPRISARQYPHRSYHAGFHLGGGLFGRRGIGPIGRLCELYFPVLVFTLLISLALAYTDFEIDNIRPILGEGIAPAFAGLKSTALSYTGIEVVLVLTAFMTDPRKAVKAVMIGTALVIPLYTLVVFVTIGVLTLDEVTTLTWPLMSLAKEIDLPGGFFDRFEALVSVLWVIANYTSFVPNYYLACEGMGTLFHKNYRLFMYGLLPLIYLIAVYPENLNSVMKFGTGIGYYDIAVGGLIPLLSLILAKGRGIGIAKG